MKHTSSTCVQTSFLSSEMTPKCGRVHYDWQRDLYEVNLNDGRACLISAQVLDRFLEKPRGCVVVDGSVQSGELDSRREIGGPGPKELTQ